MTHANTLSRRSVTTGLAAAVVAIPAVGLAVAAIGDPVERVKRLTRELEEAMREAYGGEVLTCSWGPHSSADPDSDKPAFFIVAHPRSA